MSVVISGDTGIDTIATGAITRAKLPAGTVLQTVNVTYNTDTSTTSGSYVDSGLAATITPTSTSSKILVTINTPSRKGAADNAGTIRVVRGSTGILNAYTYLAWNGGSAYAQESYGLTYLDSPATTSATTYKLQFACMNGTSPAFSLNHDGSYSTITLQEIAG